MPQAVSRQVSGLSAGQSCKQGQGAPCQGWSGLRWLCLLPGTQGCSVSQSGRLDLRSCA